MSDEALPGHLVTPAGRFVRDVIEDVRASRRAERLGEGYNEAANVCTGLVDEYLGELHKKAASGLLTKLDQALLAKLIEIRAAMETELDRHWDELRG